MEEFVVVAEVQFDDAVRMAVSTDAARKHRSESGSGESGTVIGVWRERRRRRLVAV